MGCAGIRWAVATGCDRWLLFPSIDSYEPNRNDTDDNYWPTQTLVIFIFVLTLPSVTYQADVTNFYSFIQSVDAETNPPDQSALTVKSRLFSASIKVDRGALNPTRSLPGRAVVPLASPTASSVVFTHL